MDNTSIITQVSNPKEEGILSCAQEKVSQCNISLKKQRNRSIFSSLFCCFRSYSVEPPTSNNNSSPLPPLVEENGGIQKPPAKYLLPELKVSDYGKKCVVIDLDETLVHSSFKPINNADFIVPVEIDGTIHQVYVLKRPHVDEFLQKMGELFECVLFTASLAKVSGQRFLTCPPLTAPLIHFFFMYPRFCGHVSYLFPSFFLPLAFFVYQCVFVLSASLWVSVPMVTTTYGLCS
ncbi:hypothetical protein XENTR_v10015721 [Xenopus tropicalis]|nr:hypothetical protein XENTR_v10015721 [Xenopus tropicalis]